MKEHKIRSGAYLTALYTEGWTSTGLPSTVHFLTGELHGAVVCESLRAEVLAEAPGIHSGPLAMTCVEYQIAMASSGSLSNCTAEKPLTFLDWNTAIYTTACTSQQIRWIK